LLVHRLEWITAGVLTCLFGLIALLCHPLTAGTDRLA
jgi:hypothetical protein